MQKKTVLTRTYKTINTNAELTHRFVDQCGVWARARMLSLLLVRMVDTLIGKWLLANYANEWPVSSNAIYTVHRLYTNTWCTQKKSGALAHSRTKQFPVIQFDNIELDSAFRVIHAIKWSLNTLVVNGRLPRWSEYISDRFHWISQQNNKQPNEQQKIGFVFLSTHFHDEIVQQVLVYIHHWTLLMWMLQVSK